MDAMNSTDPSRHASAGPRAAVGCFIAAVVSAAFVGVLVAFQTAGAATGAAGHDGGANGAFRVAQDVPTSFGFVAVEHAETLKGLSARQMGGATHGIGSFVGRDKALVQASVTITNTGEDTLPYSPKAFRLVAKRAGKPARRYGLMHATVTDGVLQPDAAVDARLSFVAPRDGSELAIEFRDPGRTSPIRIELDNRSGRVSKADREALADGHHGTPAASGPSSDGHDHGQH
jgi:hypothetical protein